MKSAVPGKQKKIRIAHIVLALNIGGLEQVVWDLVRKANRDRYEFSIICLEEPGSNALRFRQSGIEVISLDAKGAGKFKTVARLLRVIWKLRPHIVHTHNPTPHLAGALATALLRFPSLIHTKHGRNQPEVPKAVFVNRVASALSDSIVGVSLDAFKVVRDIEKISSRKIKLIHNGIDLSNFLFVDRPLKTKCLHGIHVARLNMIKDQKTLLKSIREVVKQEPEFKLTIVGNGPLKEELISLRDELGITNSVNFLGERSNVHDYLAQADFFVLSSLKEGLSLTILEAMASGLAVIATDVGGNREAVTDGKTGLLVPSQSPELLAQAIVTLIRDPKRTMEMGRAGRDKVEKLFSLDAMVKSYEECYEREVSSRP